MADKDKTKARLPRGFADRLPDDIRAVEEMLGKIRAVYELYGFEPYDQPLIEYTDALGKFLPDQDRPNEGVFSFQDDDEQWLSLRYDLTAPMARFVAENFERLPKPFRIHHSGWVFRNEKPGPGRFRQFMQCDADSVGVPGVAADAEMAMMMADVMEKLEIPRGDYVIRVYNRKVLDGLLDTIGLVGEANMARRLIVLRAIDKLDKFDVDQVKLLLTVGRWDGGAPGVGDFTPGAGLEEDAAELVLRFFTVRPNPQKHLSVGADGVPEIMSSDWSEPVKNSETLDHILATASAYAKYPVAKNPTFLEGLNELRDISNLAAAAGYESDRVRIDPSVVRGLEYYTGPVFEAELLAEIPNDQGKPTRLGSVGGGGRYDGLVSRFRGEPVPATGFSIGVSRLMTALKSLGKLDSSGVVGPVVVLVMDRDTDSLGRYQQFVSRLRNAKDKDGKPAGIRAEMYLGASGMKAQMKYADKRGAPCVVIQGGDERALAQVQIKDMALGEQLSKEISDNAAWREGRPAQFSVAEAELVEAVRKVLDAQKAERAG